MTSDPRDLVTGVARAGAWQVDRQVFLPATILLALLVVGSAVAPEASEALFQRVQAAIVRYASWYYVLVVAVVLVSVLLFSLSRFGDVKLGPDHSTPDYSAISWFAMLFAAGMGIGLMFFGVAEPVMHFLQPPLEAGGTVDAASHAMTLTFFHWGLHAWAIYAIAALLLAYFSYRHGLPLTVRSAFYPLIGERIYGPLGAAIDVFAIVCTACGIATSLGFGVLQINSGLAYLFGVPVSKLVQVVLIAVTMGLASISVAMGLNAGIKRLSELNIAFSIILLAGVLITGPTILLLAATLENLGDYLSELISKTFTLYAYEPTDWLGGWTIFYWGWWLSWSPFVGLFIARISRGRTIREFTLGAMLVPCGFTLLWMGVFGNSAIDLILNQGAEELAEAVSANQAEALFRFLEYLPLSNLLAGVSLAMVVVFFVTSADSGALVLNMLSAHGRDDTPVLQRVFWAALVGAIASVLLLSGGLASLQTAAIASALPFSLALLGAIWGFAKALSLDVGQRTVENVTPAPAGAGDWRSRLDSLLTFPADEHVERFLRDEVLPALREFAAELKKHDIEARVTKRFDDRSRVRLEVLSDGEIDFLYEVRCRPHAMPDERLGGTALASLNDDDRYYRAEVHLSQGGRDYCIMGWSREQISHDVLDHYENHLEFLKSLR
ncbi:MAG: BCCT family transporter [Halieaceae bacterium]|jgi:choline/glycine/proline betaine transport protein|nr:BCCT family transporter [Halieaceae bacterium]